VASIQFTIPRRAAEVVDFVALRRYGAEAKLPRTMIEYSTHSTPVGQTRITCSIDMAVFLIEALSRLAAEASDRGGKPELVIACAEGVKSTFDAIDAERAKPSDESPASHVKPAPN
jgi:hypothetical protein